MTNFWWFDDSDELSFDDSDDSDDKQSAALSHLEM